MYETSKCTMGEKTKIRVEIALKVCSAELAKKLSNLPAGCNSNCLKLYKRIPETQTLAEAQKALIINNFSQEPAPAQ